MQISNDSSYSDFDLFSNVVTMFPPPPFIGALSHSALILQLHSILTKLFFSEHRMKVGGIGLDLCPFLTLFWKGGGGGG